jgi:transcriptional regulator with XRE-family HTH domain
MASSNPKPICERIGRRLLDRRKALGLTQREIAARAGLPFSYLSELEHGKAEPGAGNILRLCRVLGLSADALLGVNEWEGPAGGE